MASGGSGGSGLLGPGGPGSNPDSQDDDFRDWSDMDSNFTGDTIDLGLKLNRFKKGLIKLLNHLLKKCEKSGRKPSAYEYAIPFKEIKNILAGVRDVPDFDKFGYHGKLQGGKIHPKIVKMVAKYMKHHARYSDFVKDNARDDSIILQQMQQILALESLLVSLLTRTFDRAGLPPGFSKPVNADNHQVRYFKHHDYATPDKTPKQDPGVLPEPELDPRIFQELVKICEKLKSAKEKYDAWRKHVEKPHIALSPAVFDRIMRDVNIHLLQDWWDTSWFDKTELRPADLLAMDQLGPGAREAIVQKCEYGHRLRVALLEEQTKEGETRENIRRDQCR